MTRDKTENGMILSLIAQSSGFVVRWVKILPIEPGEKNMELDWNARPLSEDATVITTVDAHAAGEPLRIITGGLPTVPGTTMLERRRYLQEHLDHIREALIWEPRGHRDMYGCVLTRPVTPGADLGVLFMHNEGYSTMCGHGVIALVTVAAQNGMVKDPSDIRIDAPAGLVKARADVISGRVQSVTFENVPSFVYATGLTVADTSA